MLNGKSKKINWKLCENFFFPWLKARENCVTISTRCEQANTLLIPPLWLKVSPVARISKFNVSLNNRKMGFRFQCTIVFISSTRLFFLCRPFSSCYIIMITSLQAQAPQRFSTGIRHGKTLFQHDERVSFCKKPGITLWKIQQPEKKSSSWSLSLRVIFSFATTHRLLLLYSVPSGKQKLII